tara:strand:+ start:7948 stop:17496 length:9549 start_codon:yes stop_codon:yes gene_type:complete
VTLKNPTLVQLDSLVRQKIIEPQEYFNRLELAYRTNPSAFTEEEVDYIERQFKKVDIKFNRDMEVADANLLSTMNQFTSGLVEGFTTLGWAEDPDTTVESIANKFGHLIGFAPDVVASFFSMGQYVPIAAAKRAGLTGQRLTRAALSSAADKAPGFIRKEIGPKTFTLQSIPMKVADYVMEQSKEYLGAATLTTSGYLSRGIFKSAKFRNIAEQGLHLGVALGVSSWKEGGKGMLDSALHGAAAGALFGGIGNYVNVGRLLANPKTRKAGERIIRDVASQVSKDARQTEAVNMLIKGTLGSVAQGGMATRQGLPVAEQVYEYLLGAFFGATARSAGFADRTKFIMKNDYKNYELGMTEKQAIEVARKDADFQKLSKSDQQYIENYIAKVVVEKYNTHAPIMANLQQIPEINEALTELGIDPKTITKKQFEQVMQKAKEKDANKDLKETDGVELEPATRPAEERGPATRPGEQRGPATRPAEEVVERRTSEANKDTVLESALKDKIDVNLSEMIEMTLNRDMNEPMYAIKNRDLELIADEIRTYSIGKSNDAINLELAKIAKETNYDLQQTIAKIRKTYPELPSTFFRDVGGNVNRLGSYLKLKKHFNKKTDWEIDLSADVIEIRPVPERDINGDILGGDRPNSKYNKTFPATPEPVRLVIRKAVDEAGFTKMGIGGKERITKYRRSNGGPLDYKNLPAEQVKTNNTVPKEQFTTDVKVRLKKSLREKGMYIYGGSKDNGTLLIHRYPVSETSGQKNFFNKTARDKFFNRLENELGLTLSNKNKETFSNIYYLMVESGYLDPALPFTGEASSTRLIKAVKEYLKEPLYANVQKFNKYSNLAQGADIPLEAADYVNLLKADPAKNRQEGLFNMIMVKDFEDPMFNNSESGTDAAVIASYKAFDTIQTKNFRPADNGFLKLVGYKGPEYGSNPVGNILLKTGTFRATKAQNDFMEANGIDFIVPSTAAKTQLGLKLHTLDYTVKDGWKSIDVLKPFTMRPDELYINMGVYENATAKLNQPAPFQKQILDKINRDQLGRTLSRELVEDYRTVATESLNGNANETAKFNQMIKDINIGAVKDVDSYKFDINDIHINSINEVISNDITSPLAIATIKKILNRGREDYRELMFNTTDDVASKLMNLEVYEIPDLVNKLDYDPGILLQPQIKKFIDKALIRYRTSRVVQPLIKYSTTGKLGPRDIETYITHPELNDTTFMLGRDFRDYEIKLDSKFGGKDGVMTLSEAFKKSKDTKNYTASEISEIKESINFLLVRSPNSSNGGVRVLEFAGFVDRKGYGVYTTSKNDYYLGGADKDADSVSIYQNMPKSFKEAFRKYDNEFDLGGGVLYNFETPSKTFEKFVKEADKVVNPKKDFAELVDVDSRIEVARMARRGKQQMGIIVDAMTRMQNIADVIQRRGGVFESSVYGLDTAKGSNDKLPERVSITLKDSLPGLKGKLTTQQVVKQLQLDSVNLVNLMADSANFKEIGFYNSILNQMWNSYFKIKQISGLNNEITYLDTSGKKQTYNIGSERIIGKKGDMRSIAFDRNYFKDTDHIYALRLIENVHRDFYKLGKDSIKRVEHYDKLAEDYLFEMGTDIPFYYNIAEAVRMTPDFYLDPYKFYFNNAASKNLELSNIGPIEVVKLQIKKLRELIKSDKMFKRFGMRDFWNSHIETEADLTRLINDPYFMHEKNMDYQGIFFSLQKSKDFIRESNALGVPMDKAESIVRDVMDTTYNIKSYFFTEVKLRGLGNMQNEKVVTPEIMNSIILRLKDKYKNAYKPETYEKIEEMIDYWLMTRDFREPTTDLLKQQEKDFMAMNDKLSKELEFHSQSQNWNGRSEKIEKLLSRKSMAYGKLRPTLDFAYKSLVISNKNRESFFKGQYKLLQEITENITEQVKLPEKAVNLKKFIKENIPFDDTVEIPDNFDTSNSRTFKKTTEIDPDNGRTVEFITPEQARYNETYPNNINVRDDKNVSYKVKQNERFKKDTQSSIDNVQTTNEILNEILPQFDWLSVKLKPNKLVTDEAQVQIDRTRSILRKNPAAISRFEEFFIDLTFRLEGIGRRLSTINVKDLEILNNALEERFSSKSIIQKLSKKDRPGWIDQMLNYKVIGKKLEKFEETEYLKPAVPVIDKYGQQKPKQLNIILPTSTLEYGRKRIDKFDTLQKLMSSGIETQHNGYYNFLNIDNANLTKYRNLLIEHAWNVNEYQNGKYPSNERLQSAKDRIKEAYLDSEGQIKKLGDMKFPWPTSGKSEMITATEYTKRLADMYAKDFKQINEGYIKSNWENIEKFLKKQKITRDLYSPVVNTDLNVQTYKKSARYATDQMERMFLDKNGIIRENLVNLIFKNFDFQGVPNRKSLNDLFSINDFFFIKYHMQVKDRFEFAYPEINLDKPLKPADQAIVKRFVNKEMSKKSYADHIVGDVYRGYMPRMGQFDIEANIPKIQKFMAERINRKVEEVSKPGNQNKLPLDLRMAVEFGEMPLNQAIKIYKDQLTARFNRQATNDISDGGYEVEAQVRDLFTRSNYKGYVGEYTASMLKNRGDEFIPFYKKDLDVIKRYKQSLIKSHLTNLAGFSSELLLRRFDKVNKKETFAENWSRFMRDAFTNMIGMSNYRALNIHGIEKKDQGLYNRYIKNGLSTKGMMLTNAQREKILDFGIAIRVNGAEKEQILLRNTSKDGVNLKKAKQELRDLQMTRAKKLVKDINVTGKYGSLYHATSDEKAVSIFKGINTLFGGKLFGELPKVDKATGVGESEYRNAVLKRVRDLSDLEGQFELISLLSHPKTAITNMYGGTVNTISDVGWSSFRKANSTKDVLSMLQSMNAEFEFTNPSTGKKEKRGFESRTDIDAWLESLGVYDQMFLDMVSLDRNFAKKNVQDFAQQFVIRMNKSLAKDPGTMSKAAYEQLQKRTMKELARDLNIKQPFIEAGALPMKWSERKLRGTAFLANYINLRENVLGPIKDQMPYDSPVLINYALKGVQASQFMYQATFRPNFANTSLGRVLTRFQPYAWNSIGRRMNLYKDARQADWNREVLASKKFQRQFTFDLMSLALANIFVASIFEYALSPPMNWMQDTAALLFGDKNARDRAFFSSYPHPVLAPLQIVTPPIGRFVLQPITAILNQDWQTFTDYTLYSYFPYGRLFRDAQRTYDSPAMAPDYLTGFPLHRLHDIRRTQIEEDESEELLPDFSLWEDEE